MNVVIIPCVNTVYSWLSENVIWLFTTKVIMYSHVLNRILHEFLSLTPVMIPKMFFCKENIILLLDHEIFDNGIRDGIT
jgi:hypothetical protein